MKTLEVEEQLVKVEKGKHGFNGSKSEYTLIRTRGNCSYKPINKLYAKIKSLHAIHVWICDNQHPVSFIFSIKTKKTLQNPALHSQTKMRAALKRNATVSQLLQSHNKKFTSFFTDPVARIYRSPLKNQAQKDYNKFPNFWRKSVREYNEVSPSLFSSVFSAFISGTPSSSKTGFVGWYLGMVKSRPVLTKSITCALIYTAADLSSQVIK